MQKLQSAVTLKLTKINQNVLYKVCYTSVPHKILTDCFKVIICFLFFQHIYFSLNIYFYVFKKFIWNSE